MMLSFLSITALIAGASATSPRGSSDGSIRADCVDGKSRFAFARIDPQASLTSSQNGPSSRLVSVATALSGGAAVGVEGEKEGAASPDGSRERSDAARKRFEGKVAIVTGAGRSMGRATALTLAAAGARVVVNDAVRSRADSVAVEIRRGGGEALSVVADVSRPEQVRDMVETTLERFGTVDFLVNNAGILRTTTPLEDISDDEWDLMLSVNLRGAFNCIRAVLPTMKAKRFGKIVNVSSSAGRSTSTFGGAHYTAAKAGVLGLTRHAAREASPYNVNVNAVAPGSMDTEMVREMSTPERMERAREGIPLGRLGTAQDLANLVAFLCSDESSYIAGATIDINGADLLL